MWNLARGSEWAIDAGLSLLFLIIMMLLNRWLKMQWIELTMFNIGLLAHNLGAFGFYEWSYGFIGYDNVVHFISSFAAAYIIFNFITRRLHVKKNKNVKQTVIDEHKAIIIFLVIASVAMLGTCIELMEFGGAYFLGEGEGLLLVGSGDDAGRQYFDTMTDILVNTLGTIIGATAYYFAQYERKPWLHA